MKIAFRVIASIALVLFIIVGSAVAYIYFIYGGGQPYVDLTGAPLLAADALQIVVT